MVEEPMRTANSAIITYPATLRLEYSEGVPLECDGVQAEVYLTQVGTCSDPVEWRLAKKMSWSCNIAVNFTVIFFCDLVPL